MTPKTVTVNTATPPTWLEIVQIILQLANQELPIILQILGVLGGPGTAQADVRNTITIQNF